MSLIGSSWKEEPSPEEIYKEITGDNFIGSKTELKKEIEKEIDNQYTSRLSRNKLQDLLKELENG